VRPRPEPPPSEVERLLTRMAELQQKRQTLGELGAQVLEESAFITGLFAALRPGLRWREAGEAVRQRCARPFEVSALYLSRVDWAADQIHFPYFFEAGRVRERASRACSDRPGLTGRVLELARPLYLDSKEACMAEGMVLSDAELTTGLMNQSWFGVPLFGRDRRPAGVLAFQSFQPAAFPPHRLQLMEAVAGITALHLGSD